MRQFENRSGVIALPSQRTLRDYTHFVQSRLGFSDEVDEQLMEAAKVTTLEEYKKCVIIIVDEMHIKGDLVFDNREDLSVLSWER